jgi:hypothetical protein
VGAKSTSAFAQTAQPWLEDRRETQGIGFRTGNLELHPGIAGELGYDSNFFQGSGDPTEPVMPSARLRLTPSLSIQTLGRQRLSPTGTEAGAEPGSPKVAFRSNLALSLDKLFSLEEQYVDQINSQTHLGADLNAQLGILPDAPWGADLQAGYMRLEQPYNTPGSVTLDRSIVRGGGDVRWRPGGGLLEWKWGYAATLATYDNVAAGLDSLTHNFTTRGTWRFLPRTGLLYLADIGYVARRSVQSRIPAVMPISSQLGINGLITSSFGALLLGGWKVMFADAMPNGTVQELDTPIGRAEVTWFIDKQGTVAAAEGSAGFSTLKLGVLHDGFASELSTHYRLTKGYLSLSAILGSVVFLQASGGVAFVRHVQPLDDNGAPLASEDIKEWRQDAALYAEYRLSSTLALFSNSSFSASPKNNRVSLGGGIDSLKYQRFTSLLGVRWFL